MGDDGINRRNFLWKFFTCTFGGKVLFDTFQNLHGDYVENKILYGLKNHVHLIKASGEAFFEEKGFVPEYRIGCGIIVDNKYLTAAHILNFGEKGRLFEVDLYGSKLKKEVLKFNNDVAIYNLDSNLAKTLLNFPCKIHTNVSLGEEVYVVGNPRLTGSNIRKICVSDLDGYDGVKNDFDMGEKSSFFGVGGQIIPGDSGCPVVNKNFELVGICALTFYGLGYIKRIEEFSKEFKNIQELRKTPINTVPDSIS